MPGDPSDRPRNPVADRSPAMNGLAAERRATSRDESNVADAFGDEAPLPCLTTLLQFDVPYQPHVVFVGRGS